MKLLAAFVAITLWTCSALSRPNIVLILADDMGFSDIGCYGGEVQTPNIDRLASRGLRFTQFYNAGRCCPTRTSLLTGLYPHQAGVPHMVDNLRLPLEQRQLSRKAVTIAEVLGEAGYLTAMSGKWHVCPMGSQSTNGPMERGFDHFYGIIHGASSFFSPVSLIKDRESITNFPKDFFLTDAIAENAANYVREFSLRKKPFFIYTAFTAPHWPLHAPQEDIAKYLPEYRVGWDSLREERFKRQVKSGIIDKRTKLAPRDPDAKSWNEAQNREWQTYRMAVYAAQIERMDRGIGSLIEALRETGNLDNTLILFLSDNGGCAENLGPNMKALHVPALAPDGGEMRLGNSPQILPGSWDTYASYGLPWANLSNTPFRSYKHWVHEGGIATPLIVHWPAQIRKAGLRNEPGHLIDIMATCVAVSGASYPSTFGGNKILPMEGKNLEPVLRGKKLAARPIFFEHEGNRAIRLGKWKAVSRYPEDWELYDMESDRSEVNNLAGSAPKRLKKLTRQYEEWSVRAGVPPPNLVAQQQPARR